MREIDPHNKLTWRGIDMADCVPTSTQFYDEMQDCVLRAHQRPLRCRNVRQRPCFRVVSHPPCECDTGNSWSVSLVNSTYYSTIA